MMMIREIERPRPYFKNQLSCLLTNQLMATTNQFDIFILSLVYVEHLMKKYLQVNRGQNGLDLSQISFYKIQNILDSL